MNLSETLARFARKAKAFCSVSTSGEWLDTAEGRRSEQVGELVYNELENAFVDTEKRRVILEGGAMLTVCEVSQNIADKSMNDLKTVRLNVLEWIEEAADAVDDADEELIRMRIRFWLQDERRSARRRG